jgi:ribonucleoside-diphosphate reductase beta chain
MKNKCKVSLYDRKKVDLTQHKLFDFDNCTKNTQRFDVVRYPKIDQINDTMLSFFWRPEEISMGKDKSDYETNTDEYEKFILTEQLKKLVMLDSLQGRSPIFTFGQLTSNPEFENAVLTWDFFEGAIHSRSYSHVIQSVYPDPSVVFDETFDNKLLMNHTKTITRDYNELYPEVIKYLGGETVDKKEFKKQILLALVSVNILEGIRFYSGFASVWALTEFRNVFAGSSKILQLIARDENVHMALTQTIINTLRKNDEEGFKEIFEEITPQIYDMYFEAAEEEFEWIDYLYQKGCPLGINQNIAKDYIKYLTNLRLKAIGLKTIYPGSTKNPINWINKWLNFGSSESALQEIESIDYQSGGLIMEDVDYKKLMESV